MSGVCNFDNTELREAKTVDGCSWFAVVVYPPEFKFSYPHF